MEEQLIHKVKPLTIWKSSLPYLAMILIGTLTGPINTFISSGVNRTAVESIGTAAGVLGLFGTLLTLLTGGANIIVGQYIGQKDKKILKEATDTPLIIVMSFSAVIIGLVIIIGKYLLMAWGVQEGTQQMRDGLLYLRVMGATLFVMQFTGYMIGILGVYGRPKAGMIIGITATLADIAFSAIFVYAADLGFWGVMLGTITARGIALILGCILYSKFVQPIHTITKFSWRMSKRIMRISLPIAGERMNYSGSQFVQGIIIGNVAVTIGMVVGGHNMLLWSRAIFGSLQRITLVGGAAMAAGLEPVLSRSIGAEDFSGAKRDVRKAWFAGIAIDIPLACIIFGVNPYLVDWLTTAETNRSVVAELKNILWPSFGWLILMNVGRVTNLVYISAGRAAGDVKATFYASIVINWIFAILMGFLLVRYTNMGWSGIVLAMAADECLRGLFNYGRWKTNKWQKIYKEYYAHKPKRKRNIRN